MSDDLNDFTANLNSAGGPPRPGQGGPPGPPRGPGGPGGMPQNLTPQQKQQIAQAQAMKAKLDARPLELDTLKGKLDVKWLGHAGFKIHFLDAEDIHRNIYIDIWADNKNCPESDKKTPPNDADLSLVTAGQLDHSMHAPFLMMAGKREKRQIVSTTEVGLFFQTFRKMPAEMFVKLQPGGHKDFGWCKITMTTAQYPSTCQGPQGQPLPGGLGVGFVVEIPHHNISFYHAGNTNLFSDMKIINDLYRPDVSFLPIGDNNGMGPREAAYCAKNFLTHSKTFIPMNFGSFPTQTGTFEDFQAQCEEMGVTAEVKDPKGYFGGAAVIEA